MTHCPCLTSSYVLTGIYTLLGSSRRGLLPGVLHTQHFDHRLAPRPGSNEVKQRMQLTMRLR
jgi:hypothetical protein